MTGSIRYAQTQQDGSPGQPAPPASRMQPSARAELIVDPVQGSVDSANTQACRLLKLPAGVVFPLALDTAMPAMRRLREIDQGAAAAAEEDLKFWCAGRLVRVSAKVLKETMSDGQTRLVVRALHEEPCPTADRQAAETAAGDQESMAAQAHVDEPLPDVENSSPPVPRDDRETLREIARRIREGHKPGQGYLDLGPAECAASPPIPAQSEEPQTFEGAPLPPRQPVVTPDARALSKIAHELKTPLSAIVAAAEIMRDEQLGPMGNPKYLGYAGDIFESARHALDVINAMLTGTPGEARTFGPVDLSEIAVATVSVMQPLARTSGINLQADCGEERLQVTGDATAIRQIIYNLISNALKFTPQGGEVHVVTGYLPKGVPFFVVRDTGEGMSEDDIVRAFYRDDTRIGARRGGGYGIGLPMVRRLAEMMNATIDVDSEPGKGTVVLVTFPGH